MKRSINKMLCVILSVFVFILTGCGSEADEMVEEAVTEVYSGEGFQLTFSPEKWEYSDVIREDGSKYVTFVRKEREDVEFHIERTFDNSGDSVQDVLEVSEIMGEMDGIDLIDSEIASINGWNWCRAEFQQRYSGHVYCLAEFTAFKSAYRYDAAFTAENMLDYSECLPEFEEVFDTFEFV